MDFLVAGIVEHFEIRIQLEGIVSHVGILEYRIEDENQRETCTNWREVSHII